MKLLTKTGLYYFLLSLFVMVLGAMLFYKSLVKYVDGSSTGELKVQKEKIIQEFALIDSVPVNNYSPNGQIQFKKIGRNDSIMEWLSDTMLVEPPNVQTLPYRVLYFNAHTRLYNYEISLAQSQVAGDDLVEVIIKSVAVMIALFLMLLLLINQTIVKQIWKPFYHSLNQLQLFDIQQTEELKTIPSSIKEFNELNQALEQMSAKNKTGYRNLREFTENASHEIQTPLAVIRSKVELLLQTENLNETQWKQLSAINQAADRLSRLNQSLLLLSKIENGQFNDAQNVSITDALQQQTENLRELIAAKNIELREEIEPQVFIQLHPYLLDILLSNLLMNAIRHNNDSGFIHIRLTKKMLSIQNSGMELTVNPNELFVRFKKGNSESSSTGIGLSIVKKIAEMNGMKINYTCHAKVHSLALYF